MRKVSNRLAYMFFLCLFATACEKGDNRNAEMEIEMEQEIEEIGTETESQDDFTDVFTIYTTEVKFSDQEISAVYTDDWSFLDQIDQTEFNYAYQDGKVYYRQYHKDSLDGWNVIAGKDKKMISIDEKGEKNVVFSDKGYGNIYLIGERFYIKEKVYKEEGDEKEIEFNFYSVDMQGQNRLDYGEWEICALDMERNIFILNRSSWEEQIDMYCVLDCAKDEIIPLPMDSYNSFKLLNFWAYHDGWCYFDVHEEWGSGICRVVGISLDGEQKEIMTMTSPYNKKREKYRYTESICRMEIVEDRIYMIFGGYEGSDSYFQGGSLITMKLDGSDYRAIECKEDAFVICKDGDRTLVYFPYYWSRENWPKEKKHYLMGVWDIETNTIFPSDFPRELVYEQQRHSILTYQEYIIPKPLCLMKEDGINVYALEDSGRIVQVATDIDKAIIQRENKEINYSIDYENLYYADGFLYFEVEFTIFEGARTYRRIQKDVYRMKLDEKSIELLYSY